MPEINYRVDRAVAVISFANPPVNGLSHAVRAGISAALERAQADPSVRAIVLTGAGGLFSGGADIREFGTPASTAEPTLRQLIDQVETSAKPVVAAIAGTCLGGGLELALAAHYRVASADAKLGLPEVKLGLLPGRGWHPAAAPTGRRRKGDRHDRERRAGAGEGPGRHCPARSGGGRRSAGEAVELAASAEVATRPPPRTRDIPLDEPSLAALCEAARARLETQRPLLPAPAARGGRDRSGGRTLRGRTRHRAARLPRADGDAGVEGAQACLLRGARGRQGGRHHAIHPRPSARAGRRDRRRHHGRGDRRRAARCRHPALAGRSRPGGAGAGRDADRRHLRRADEEGQAHSRASGTAACRCSDRPSPTTPSARPMW